jgi:hypothetical protein
LPVILGEAPVLSNDVTWDWLDIIAVFFILRRSLLRTEVRCVHIILDDQVLAAHRTLNIHGVLLLAFSLLGIDELGDLAGLGAIDDVGRSMYPFAEAMIWTCFIFVYRYRKAIDVRSLF